MYLPQKRSIIATTTQISRQQMDIHCAIAQAANEPHTTPPPPKKKRWTTITGFLMTPTVETDDRDGGTFLSLKAIWQALVPQFRKDYLQPSLSSVSTHFSWEISSLKTLFLLHSLVIFVTAYLSCL